MKLPFAKAFALVMMEAVAKTGGAERYKNRHAQGPTSQKKVRADPFKSNRHGWRRVWAVCHAAGHNVATCNQIAYETYP